MTTCINKDITTGWNLCLPSMITRMWLLFKHSAQAFQPFWSLWQIVSFESITLHDIILTTLQEIKMTQFQSQIKPSYLTVDIRFMFTFQWGLWSNILTLVSPKQRGKILSSVPKVRPEPCCRWGSISQRQDLIGSTWISSTFLIVMVVCGFAQL